MADELIKKSFIQLKGADNRSLFPRIHLGNVEADSLLNSDLVQVGVTGDDSAQPITLTDKLNALTQQIAGLNYFSFKAENRPAIPADADEYNAFWEEHRYTIFLEKRVNGVGSKASDICDEYILVPTKGDNEEITALNWELIGNTELNLSEYITEQDIKNHIKSLKVNGRFVFADEPESVRATDIKLSTEYAKAAEATDVAATDTVEAAISKLDKRVSDLQEATDTSFTNYEINGYKFSEAENSSVTLDGDDIKLTDMTSGTAEDIKDVAAVTNADTVNQAVSKLSNMATLALYYEFVEE